MKLRTGALAMLLALGPLLCCIVNPGRVAAASEQGAANKADQVAKISFPQDGVLLVVSLQAIEPIRMGAVAGCNIRLHVDRVLRLEAGKEPAVSGGNPLGIEKTLRLLAANKANRVLLYRRLHNIADAAAEAEDKRLNALLKEGRPYLLVLPSVGQLSPVPPLPIGNMPWAQINGGEKGLLILDFSAASVRQLPTRVKAVDRWMGELSVAQATRQSLAIDGLAKNSDLAERLLLRELAKAKGNQLRAVALALAELGDAAATEALARDIRGDDPAAAHKAILALRKISGWQRVGVSALIGRLGDEQKHGEGEAVFVLSDEAVKTLEQTTRQQFGKDKAKWEQWLENAARPSNDNLPGGLGRPAAPPGKPG